MSGRGGRGGGGSRAATDRGGKKGYVPPSGAQLLLKRSAQECGLDSRNLRSLQDMTHPSGGLYPDILWHSNGTLWKPPPPPEEEGEGGGASELQQQQQQDEMKPSIVALETTSSSTLPTLASSTAVVPTKRSASTMYLISKTRDMHHRFVQSNVYHVRPTTCSQQGEWRDVLRYRRQQTKHKQSTTTTPSCEQVVLETMDSVAAATPDYIPEELLSSAKTAAKSSVGALEDDHGLFRNSRKKRTKQETLEELEARESQRTTTTVTPQAVPSGTTIEPHAPTVPPDEAAANLSDLDLNNDEEEEGEDYVMNYYESEEESDGGENGEPTF